MIDEFTPIECQICGAVVGGLTVMKLHLAHHREEEAMLRCSLRGEHTYDYSVNPAGTCTVCGHHD